MDRPGSTKKGDTGLPALPPVREVEHGCEHLQQFMGDSDRSEKFTNAYLKVQGMLTKPLEAQTTKDVKNPDKPVVILLRPTFLCLQCSTVSSAADRDAHYQNKQHAWSIESRSGCLYCRLCSDFVYDPEFERLRLQNSFSTNGKKRKLNLVSRSMEEEKLVLPNANHLSCQSGAPRGIFNLGQTCYLSVILQTLVHNPMMKNYFLASRHEPTECHLQHCTACAMTTSFVDICTTEKLDGHGPVDLLYKSWMNNPSLAGYHQQDAHEYLQSLLNNLHGASDCVDTKSSRNCDCLYHQTFFGKLRSTVTCLQCKNMTVSEDPIIDLSLDLRQQIKKRKLEPKSPSIEHPLDLITCLKNYTSPEKLPNDAYTCRSEECGDTPQRAKKHLTIKKLPPALCIQIKRYEHNKINPQKLDIKLNFPMQLDMYPYTTRAYNKRKKDKLPPESAFDPLAPPRSERSPGWYDLSSVVVHVGKMDSGHYLCYCKRDGEWFKFDDSKVTVASEAVVLSADAYLLFYVIRNLPADGDDGYKTPQKAEKAP